ncbi:putative acetyltransferase [Salsuginibacillus halophilus]|uniref:Putative acetyltransferase n=1 Tax=Salsuginibacillus halophilus TaxID=517424 RepID=A0A2P8HX80_9BACI|nr:GNAT family N-acetyltransferase [Salsuginibacillus halophilus]PSL50830.1 putative acetyltransferase [Salsuginibacillus halophilus]
MNIRRLTMDDFEQSLSLGQFAFQNELSEEEREQAKKRFVPNDHWGIFDEENALMSKLALLPMDVYFHGSPLKACGVSSVSSWPEHRRQGHIRQLLDESLKDMYERGAALSLLYPFNISFYRNFGWELFCERTKWQFNQLQLPKPEQPEHGRIRRLKQEDWEDLNHVYQAFAAGYSGTLVRDEVWWDQRVQKSKKGQRAVYENETGSPEGYVIFEVKEQELKVKELVYTTPQAKQALSGFLGQHDSMVEESEWTVPPNESFRFFLKDPKVTEETKPYFMARVVNAEKLLKAVPWGSCKQENLDLILKDDFASWNNGIYRLHFKEQTYVEVVEAANDDAIELDVKALIPILFSYVTAEELHAAGTLQGSAEIIASLQQAVPKTIPFLYDFF